MKSKRLILIILVHYKLDILVLVVWSILCYHVVFVRNLSFFGVPIGTKNPNWDARVMSCYLALSKLIYSNFNLYSLLVHIRNLE